MVPADSWTINHSFSKDQEPTNRGVRLPVAEGDPAFGEIVGRQFQGNPVASQYANTVAPQSAGEMGQHDAVVLQLHAEQTAGELLQNRACDFDTVFLAHKPLKIGTSDISVIRRPAALSQGDAGPPGCGSSRSHIGRLQALRTPRHLKLHLGAFFQAAIPLGLDRREVNEHVFAVLALDEAISLGCVEPLYCTFFFHSVSILLISSAPGSPFTVHRRQKGCGLTRQPLWWSWISVKQ